MAFERTAFLSVIEDSYSAYYNIIHDDENVQLPLAFRADYFQRGERYFLSKSMVMYGNETNEFVYAFSADEFGREDVDACIQYALDAGLPRVKPHKEHQYTNIKVLFIAASYTPEAISEIKHRRFQKTYNHSFWGYSNLVTAAVDVDDEKVYTNAAGRDMKKYFKKLFAAQKK